MAVFTLNSKSRRPIVKLSTAQVRSCTTSFAADKPRLHTATPLPLRPERVESSPPSAALPDPATAPAQRDIDADLADTDFRTTPSLDVSRRFTLVPCPGGKPRSSGA